MKNKWFHSAEPVSPLSVVDPVAGAVARRAVYCSTVFLSGNILRFNKLVSNRSQGQGTVPKDVAEDIPLRFSSVFVPPMNEVTRILSAINEGDPDAAEQLLPLVYDELRKLAAQKLAQEKPGQTLEATALVHEAYIRLVDVEKAQHWNSRGHFFAAAAEAMRRILVDRARRKQAVRHGGGRRRLPLREHHRFTESPDDLLDLDDALTRFAAEEPAKAELVKLRFFAGLSTAECAAALGISVASAERWWAYARTWLFSELREGADEENSI
jgi:RNA polymerase sigma factor (TIGR02999 family)